MCLASPGAGSKCANFETINVVITKPEFRSTLTFLVMVRLLILA